MLTKRIIPCLDVHDGQVVKGVKFRNLVKEGDPVELGKRYSDEGADELVFLDISASIEARRHIVELARQVSKQVFIPFSVGGGLRTVEDLGAVLEAGADKTALNTAVLVRPELITESAKKFGSQCIVLSVDAKRINDRWEVYSHGGSQPTGREVLAWTREAVDRGAGEILLTGIDADGTQAGVDLEITRRVSESVSVPVIASGGIGNLGHFKAAVIDGAADAVLAASVFHRRILSIAEVKNYLHASGIPVRLTGDNL
jgi:cyclase